MYRCTTQTWKHSWNPSYHPKKCRGQYWEDLTIFQRCVWFSTSQHLLKFAADQDDLRKDKEKWKIIEWLCNLNFHDTQRKIFGSHTNETGLWLLNHSVFKSWLSSEGNVLWCQGMRRSPFTPFLFSRTLADTLKLVLENPFSGERIPC